MLEDSFSAASVEVARARDIFFTKVAVMAAFLEALSDGSNFRAPNSMLFTEPLVLCRSMLPCHCRELMALAVAGCCRACVREEVACVAS
jgi:hypothetical protein